MLKVYIDPFSKDYLSNNLFTTETIPANRDDCVSIWRYLKQYCLNHDIQVMTIDMLDGNDPSEDDIYVAFNHKDNGMKAHSLYLKIRNKSYRNPKIESFTNKILFQFEAPASMPYVYENVGDILSYYTQVFYACKIEKDNSHYFNYPQTHNEVIEEYFQKENRKFLTLINSNIRPRPSPGELYSERIKAIEFFNRTNDIHLYGFGWNKHLFFHFVLNLLYKSYFRRYKNIVDVDFHKYQSAVIKAYKGSVDSKYSALSKYTYAICFENMIMPGYVTEKLFDCFFSGTIPVYYGAPDIEKYVPKECFIDFRNFEDYDELKAFLKSLPASQIQRYKEDIIEYLNSDQYRPFTKEYFAEKFVKLVQRL